MTGDRLFPEEPDELKPGKLCTRCNMELPKSGMCDNCDL